MGAHTAKRWGRKVSREEHEEHEEALREVQEDLDEVRRVVEEPNNWLQSVMRRRIIVHTKDDTSIDGNLMAEMDDGIILRAARYLGPGMQDETTATAMAGEVWIPRSNVAFAQLDE